MKKNILITATGGRSVGSGILHALVRSDIEVKDRWNIIASDADPFAWGLYIADQSVILPGADNQDYINVLLQKIKDFNIDAIIPGSEAETNLLAMHKDQFPIPIICNRFDLMPLMMDKFSVTEKLKGFNLPYIETFSIINWQEAITKYDYPFVIKPTIGTGGSRGLHFVFSKEEIETVLPTLNKSSQYCIQPYIGSSEEEYTVGVLSDKEGNIIDSIVMRRKLMGLSLMHSRNYNSKNYAVSTGYSQGYFIKNHQIQTFCENLAISLGSRGPLNIQLRLDGNKIYVFEIHPRFSGTSPMRADVGFNEADILLRNFLLNENFSRINYQDNVAVIRAFEHVVVPIEKMQCAQIPK